jgi:hypothetical protein
VTSVFGLSGCWLLCLAVVATVLPLGRFPVRIRLAVLTIAGVALLIPVGGLPPVAHVRGVTGDLSMPTLALAAGAVFFRLNGRRMLERRELSALLWPVAAAGLFLYPLALGLTPFDPYALGYGSPLFTTALLLVTLAAWRAGLMLVVAVVLAGALACLVGLYESRNLWDYLIDPLAVIYAIGALLLSQRRQRAPVV